MIQDYDKAIQLDPNAMAYIVRGVSYAKLGQHQNAIADYTKAIRIDGSYYDGLLARTGHAFMLRSYANSNHGRRRHWRMLRWAFGQGWI